MAVGLYLLALVCVAGIAAGQVMFKYSAIALNQAGSIFEIRPMMFFGATMALYGVTSIGWVLILRHAELGKIYPIMALAFVFVPLASHWLFGERYSPGYFIGSALIATGIICIFSSSR
ncbi:MAG: 4-amino-4-deoxy-L-arabinose-phospho-UDP flippase [Burkholderiaceae bacterium]|nr:MAG: 4-amino-4-deoxy-L-arabinose-phospho-UDP flippase [Burkholderiaceae bacterium]